MPDCRPPTQERPEIPIVFCADDFGLNHPVDAGILALARQGRLSVASCMSKGAAFASDAPALAELAIGKGLHLNLTEPQVGTRFFLPLRSLILRSYARLIDANQIRTEIEEQCDAFEMAFGQAPEYVDGHQHVHQLPVVRDLLLPILQRRYGKRRPWLRSTRVPQGIASANERFKARIIEALGARRFGQQAMAAGFITSNHLLGVYDFSGDAQHYLQRLDGWLALASPGDVLMCHPACGIAPGDAIGPQREAEFSALSDPSMPTLLTQRQLRIATRRDGIRCDA